jgi:hypothetical protein
MLLSPTPYKTLKLCFLKYHPDEPFMNRLTCYVSKHKVFHVELGFDDDWYFSIMKDTFACLRKRTLDNPSYDFYAIQVTFEQYSKCLQLCKELSYKNIGFDDYGLYMIFWSKLCYTCQKHDNIHDVKNTFCSKIITQVLQEIGLEEVQHLIPACTSPSDLLGAIKNSSSTLIEPVRICRKQFKLLPSFCQSLN